VRQHERERVLILASFSENEQRVAANELRLHGLGHAFTDLVSGEQVASNKDFFLEPYRFVWLKAT